MHLRISKKKYYEQVEWIIVNYGSGLAIIGMIQKIIESV